MYVRVDAHVIMYTCTCTYCTCIPLSTCRSLSYFMYIYMYMYMYIGLSDIKNSVLKLLPKGDLRLLQLLIDIVYDNRNRLIFLKDETFDPCFESIQLKTTCGCTHVSVIVFINCIYYNYYLILVRRYFGIVIILADLNHVIRLL